MLVWLTTAPTRRLSRRRNISSSHNLLASGLWKNVLEVPRKMDREGRSNGGIEH